MRANWWFPEEIKPLMQSFRQDCSPYSTCQQLLEMADKSQRSEANPQCVCERWSQCVNCSKTRFESSSRAAFAETLTISSRLSIWLYQGAVKQASPRADDPLLLSAAALNLVLSDICFHGGGTIIKFISEKIFSIYPCHCLTKIQSYRYLLSLQQHLFTSSSLCRIDCCLYIPIISFCGIFVFFFLLLYFSRDSITYLS